MHRYFYSCLSKKLTVTIQTHQSYLLPILYLGPIALIDINIFKYENIFLLMITLYWTLY